MSAMICQDCEALLPREGRLAELKTKAGGLRPCACCRRVVLTSGPASEDQVMWICGRLPADLAEYRYRESAT